VAEARAEAEREVAMPMDLASVGMSPKQAARSVAEARAQLEELERQEAEAEQAERERQAQVKREREQAHRQLQAQLSALGEEFSQPPPEVERPGPVTRRNAREFLHPGGGESPAALLGVLATADPLVGLWHRRSQEAGRLMVMADQAGVTGALVDELDALEVRAWGAMAARIRTLAGEE
jgi:hypothetical protein